MALLLARQMSQTHSKLYTDTDVFDRCVGLADALAMLHAQSPQVIHRDIKVTTNKAIFQGTILKV